MPSHGGRRASTRSPYISYTAAAIFVVTSSLASGRLLSEPPLSVSRTVSTFVQERSAELDKFLQRLRGAPGADNTQQPPFAGNWRTAKSVDLDEFLDKAMGVGYLKRSIAVKASQTQRLFQQGDVVHLEITDRRGTMRYTLRPDGRAHSGFGFQRLPIKQKAKWARDGALLVEERYSQHIGGELHGQKCSGDACPVIRSRRSVEKASGQMVMELERTLSSGETVKTRTYYRRLHEEAS